MKNDEPDLPAALSSRLEQLFEPDAGVPAAVDAAILKRAGGRLARIRRARRPNLALRLVPIAAAAVLVLWVASRPPAVSRDVDGSGRVDILDAFHLTRKIRAGSTEGRWDLNADRRVDELDVGLVIAAAVRVDP